MPAGPQSKWRSARPCARLEWRAPGRKRPPYDLFLLGKRSARHSATPWKAIKDSKLHAKLGCDGVFPPIAGCRSPHSVGCSVLVDRIVGIETEYGCLMSSEELRCNSEVWPAKVKNYLFNKTRAGTIDLHYRDYEEPPGNGGFFFKSGRAFFHQGPIRYTPPACLPLAPLVTYEM